METIKGIINSIFIMMNWHFDLFGVNMSFWAIFVASCLISIIAKLIWGLFQ